MSPVLSGEERSAAKDVALFIDWENLRYSLWEQHHQPPNLTALMDAFRDYGRVVVARAYADWLEPFFMKFNDQARLYHAGIEPIFVANRLDPDGAGRRKNSADVRMCTDCIELMFTNPNLAKFVLVSGDADFLNVANILRRAGREVIVCGVSGSTSSRISERVDELLIYDRDIEELSAQPVPRPAAAAGPIPAPGAAPAAPSPTLDAVVQVLVGLVKEQRSQEKYPLLSWLGTEMRRRIPGLDTASYGFPKFKGLVLHAQKRGLLKVITREMEDWALLPNDPSPWELGEGSAAAPDPDGPAPSPATDPILDAAHPLEELRDLFAEMVRVAEQVEGSPGFKFMNPTYLVLKIKFRANGSNGAEAAPAAGEAVAPAAALGQLPNTRIRRLVDRALTLELLRPLAYFDPNTGKSVQAIRLNRDHPFVKEVLDDRPVPAANGQFHSPPR